MKGGIGPSGKDKWVINANVIEFMRDCTRYVLGLSVWKQYLIWRYSFGSGALNRCLIGIRGDSNLKLWVYFVGKFWKDMIETPQYQGSQIDESMEMWQSLILNPKAILKMSDDDPALVDFAYDIAKDLNSVILGAPAVKYDFEVIKVTTSYPDLPDPNHFKPKSVPQKPFNSTTLDAELNFGYFLADDKDNFAIALTIPKGSHVLHIPDIITAYPWETEVLLPFGCSFYIDAYDEGVVPYYQKTDEFTRQVQNEPFTIGPVFEVDQGLEHRVLRKKVMRVLIGTYQAPGVSTKVESVVKPKAMTVVYLKKMAKEAGIKGYAKMKKAELMKALNM